MDFLLILKVDFILPIVPTTPKTANTTGENIIVTQQIKAIIDSIICAIKSRVIITVNNFFVSFGLISDCWSVDFCLVICFVCLLNCLIPWFNLDICFLCLMLFISCVGAERCFSGLFFGISWSDISGIPSSFALAIPLSEIGAVYGSYSGIFSGSGDDCFGKLLFFSLVCSVDAFLLVGLFFESLTKLFLC